MQVLQRRSPVAVAVAVTAALVFSLGQATAASAVTDTTRSAVTGTGAPRDRNIEFVGRWDTTDPTVYKPTWAGAYLRVGFTGTTVKLSQRKTVSFWYSIDGGAYLKKSNVSGTVDLTPTPLAAGEHTLLVSYQIVAGSYTGDSVYQGLVLDEGATTYELDAPKKKIEFIGDSITAGYTSTNVALTAYPWLIGEDLGVQHTQIALSGSCLRELTAAESIRGIRCFGLQERYTKINFTDGAADWNFSNYRPDVIVINIGTNDVGHGVASADYRAAYEDLLATVRANNPHATILALRIFKGYWESETKAAVEARQAAGDDDVHFVDSTGWWDKTTMSADGTHPNDYGHQVITSYLEPIVASYL